MSCEPCKKTRRMVVLIAIACACGLLWVMTGCTTVHLTGTGHTVVVEKNVAVSPKLAPSLMGI